MLNGNERFVVRSISRNDIAAMLNDVIDEKRLTVPLFGEGDPRLTSRICGTIAERLADVYDEAASDENLGEAERELMYTLITVYFK